MLARSMRIPAYTDRRALVLALVVGIPSSVVFLWLAVRSADFGEVRHALRQADPGLVALAVVAMGAVYLLQAERWRGIAGEKRLSRRRFAEMVVVAVACNNVLPGRAGDVLRARWLAVASGALSGRALASVVLDRGSDVVVLFAFLVVSLPAVASSTWLLRLGLGALVLLSIFAAALVFARAYTSRRPRERRERSLVRRVLRDTLEGLAEPLGRRRLARALALGGAAWIVWAAVAVLVASAVGVHLSMLEALFVAAVVNLGVAVPSSPGFVGTYQWLGVESLALLDVGRERGLAFAILLHATWYIPTTLIGALVVGVRFLRRLRRRGAVAA